MKGARASKAIVALCAAGVGAGVVPALGAGPTTVDASSDNKFTPSTVTINVAEQVTFHNAGGYHNLHFADEPQPRNQPSFSSWTLQRRFDVAGRFEFVCDIHRNNGMTGVVVVQGAPPPPPPAEAPVFSARAVRKVFRRAGVVVRVSLSEPATVSGALARRRGRALRSDGRVRFTAPAGKHTVRLVKRTDGRRIAAGTYRLALRARAADGPASPPVVLRFAVR